MSTIRTYTLRILLIPVVLPLMLQGQLPHEVPGALEPKEIYFQNLTRKNGLPSNEVRCAVADFRGYVWIGTDNGLVRYDGTEMTVFQYVPGDPASLAGSTITALMESSDSLLWIGTKSGLSVYDPATARFFTYRHNGNGDGFPCDWILSFLDDGKGNVWIGTNQGLIKTGYNRESFLHIRLRRNEIPFDRENLFRWVNNILHNPLDEKHLYLATRGGILRFDTKNLAIAEDPESETDHLYRSSALYIDNDQILWTGAWDTGLKAYDLKTKKWKIYNPEVGPMLNVLSIVPQSDDELWIGTVGNGVAIFDKNTGDFHFLKSDPSNPKGLLSDWTHSMSLIDGRLWVCSNSGLSISDPRYRSFGQYFPPLELSHISGFFHDTLNRWFYISGLNSDGLYAWDENSAGWRTLKAPGTVKKGPSHFYRAMVDSEGTLWALSDKGILMKTRGMQALDYFRDQEGNRPAIIDTVLLAITETGNGDLWIGTRLDGIIRIDSSRRHFDHYRLIPLEEDGPLRSQDYKAIKEDIKGRVWFGHYNGVFFHDSDKNKFYGWVNDTMANFGITNSVIWGIETDTLGRVFFSIDDEGLMRITDSGGGFEFKLYHLNHGLNDLNLFTMDHDPEGKIWIINEGVTRFDPYRETFEVFDTRNGLHGNKNWQNHLYVDGPGNLFLNGGKSYETANTRELELTPAVRNLLIEQMEVNSEITDPAVEAIRSGTLAMKPSQRNLVITYKAICFDDIDQVKYRYMLEGYDRDWQYTGQRNLARYTNLEAGPYKFKVQVSHRGTWLPFEKSLSIRVQPDFWQTWWFLLLTIFTLAGVLIVLYKVRVGQVRKKERMQAEFRKKLAESEMQALRAQMNPHFIFNSLNSINSYILKNETEAASDFLTKFSRLVRQVLSNSRQKMVPLADDLHALKLYIELEQLRFQDSFDYEIQVDESIDSDRVLVPPLLIQPYVENSIWHGLMHSDKRGKVTISCQKEDNCLAFVIEDNGIGREQAGKYKSEFRQTKPSMGMNITSERIGLINKMYDMEAEYAINDLHHPGGTAAGTRVTLKIPMITGKTQYHEGADNR